MSTDPDLIELSPRDAARLADQVEAQAFADLYAAAPAGLQTTLGLQVRQVAGATLLLAPGLPTAMFNRVIGWGMASGAELAALDELTAAYREAGSKTWWLHWNPFASPADMPARLQERGFSVPARRSWAKMLRGIAPPPEIPSDLAIAPATDDQADAVAQAIAQAFEMPPFMAQWLWALHGRPRWRVYAITAQGEVVGGGCLFLDGATAWLGMGAVLASHRRRGGQGALMACRIADAIAAGACHIVTETGEAIGEEPNPSLANMHRCGFRLVASRLNFASPSLQAGLESGH